MQCRTWVLKLSLNCIISVVHVAHAVLCADGDLQLVAANGSLSTDGQGRVEICIGEVWGTICDDNWNTPDAQVACRVLGYSRFSM